MTNASLLKSKSSDQNSVRNLIYLIWIFYLLKITTDTSKTVTTDTSKTVTTDTSKTIISDESNTHQLLRTPVPYGIKYLYYRKKNDFFFI